VYIAILVWLCYCAPNLFVDFFPLCFSPLSTMRRMLVGCSYGREFVVVFAQSNQNDSDTSSISTSYERKDTIQMHGHPRQELPTLQGTSSPSSGSSRPRTANSHRGLRGVIRRSRTGRHMNEHSTSDASNSSEIVPASPKTRRMYARVAFLCDNFSPCASWECARQWNYCRNLMLSLD
jgi:hypothetical protein